MQIERYLSDTRFIVAIIVGIDIFFFMILNYVVNSLIAIPDMIKDLDNPGKYIGLFNVLPNITNFKEYGGIYFPLIIILIVFLVFLDIYTAYKMKMAWSEEYFNIGQKVMNAGPRMKKSRHNFWKYRKRTKAFRDMVER